MGSDPLIGEIQVFAGGYAPEGWCLCDGSLLQVSQQAALYSVIGTRFGGDGVQSFAVPDLRGRVALGVGAAAGLSTRRLGEHGGVEAVSLQGVNLPPHSHDTTLELEVLLNASIQQGSVSSPQDGAVLASGYDVEKAVAVNNYAPSDQSAVPIRGGHIAIQAELQSEGESSAHPNLMPYLALNYIIALVGEYPQRP